MKRDTVQQIAPYDAWAEYYDLLCPGLPGEAEFYVAQAVRCGGSVLELGCGTGRIAIPTAMCGVNVTGLDHSRAMLDICRAKKKAVGRTPGRLRLVRADMANFELGERFRLVTIPYRGFNHMLEPRQQRACLRTVRQHLTPGGLCILNIWVMNIRDVARSTHDPMQGFAEVDRAPIPHTRRTLVDHCRASYEPFRQRLIEEHRLCEISARGRTLQETQFRMERVWFSPQEMDNLVRLCGFEPEVIFGDFECRPFGPDSTEMIWVLRAV